MDLDKLVAVSKRAGELSELSRDELIGQFKVLAIRLRPNFFDDLSRAELVRKVLIQEFAGDTVGYRRTNDVTRAK